MLENKDHLEMRVSSTDCAFTQNASTQISVDGFVYTTYFNLPDPGELYIFISKEKFEKLQTENEELKKKLHEFDPMPEFKELLKNLYSTEDVEKLEWALNHTCGGRDSVNDWRAVSSFWQHHYEALSKLVGFSSVEEIQDYLTNEAECDTLREAVSKLKDQVKYTCDEWYSANSRNNSWKAAAECNSPKELIDKLNLLRDSISGHDTVIESYELTIKKWQKATGFSCPEDILETNLFVKATQLEHENKILDGALKEWKDITGYPSPSAVKTAIEAGASWCHAYNEVKNKMRMKDLSIALWKEATGCKTPEEAETTMRNLRGKIDEMKNFAAIASNWTDRIVED